MTKDEALKLALEALELNNSEWKSLADSGDAGYWKAEEQDHYKQTNEAITAIKQARALAENARALGLDYEPVGWWDAKIGFFEEKHFDQLQPLYTTPPAAQRQWVGLDLDDMPDIRAGDHAFLSGALWAETKLKEKNT